MKDKLGKIGKGIDKSIKEKENLGVRIAKETTKKVLDSTATMATNIGKNIEEKIRGGTKKLKEGLKIKNDMTVGQKTGKVVEKIVDLIGEGVETVAKKISESQAEKFATVEDLKTKIDPTLLIGQERGAITKDRAEACKLFLSQVVQDKESLPYKLKDMRKTIIKDVIISASANWDELLEFLLDKDVPESRAAIDFLEKEIKIVKEVNQKWLQKPR